eukprot:Skav220423  [mRNA]  locus=scaffold639:725577:727832:+ [translate_table: standard]
MTQQTLSQTWAQVSSGNLQLHDNVAMRAGRGTRPGDPTADINFSAVMTGILERFTETVIPHLATMLQGEGLTAIPPLTWMDDVSVFLEAEDPKQLIEAVRCVAAEMHLRCTEKGLVLNMQRGKTECVLRIQGRGAHAAHQILQSEPVQHSLTFQTGSDTLHLPLSNSYTHLGQKQSSAMTLDAEVQARLAKAQTALQDSRKLLAHKCLQRQCKFAIARSLVLSTLLYGSETWVRIPDCLSAKIHAFILKTYRCVLNRQNRRHSIHVSDSRIWATVSEPTADHFLIIGRLRHLRKLVIDAPPMLWQLLSQQWHEDRTGWFCEAVQALEWLKRWSPAVKHLPDPVNSLQEWFDFIRAARGRWKALCKSALGKAARHHQMTCRVQVWKDTWSACLAEGGDHSLPAIDAPMTVQASEEFACDLCSKVFASGKALAVHRKTQHNVYALVRHYMPHALQCQSCLKAFGNSQKLRQHLQHGQTGCFDHLQSVLVPMTVPEIDAVSTVSMRQTKDQFRQPAIQHAGPRLPTRLQWTAAAPWKCWPRPPRREAATDSIQCILMDWFLNDAADFPMPACAKDPDLADLEWFEDYVDSMSVDHTLQGAVLAARDWIGKCRHSHPVTRAVRLPEVCGRPHPDHSHRVRCFGLDSSTLTALSMFSRNLATVYGFEVIFDPILDFLDMSAALLATYPTLMLWERGRLLVSMVLNAGQPCCLRPMVRILMSRLALQPCGTPDCRQLASTNVPSLLAPSTVSFILNG